MPKNREQFDIEINLQQIFLILKRRWPFIVAGGILGGILGGVPPLFDTPIYKAGGTLQLVPQRSISVSGVSNDSSLLQPTSALTNPLATELLVLKSRPILEKVVETLDLRDPTGNPLPAGYVGNGIEAEILTQTDVIKINYTATRPQEAADVVNTLMESYIRHNIKTNRAQAEATRKFIDGQLPEVQKELKEVELALRRFKETNKINSLQQEANIVTESLNGLENQILAQQRELLQLDARLTFLNEELGLTPEQAIAANALTQSTGIQSVYRQLQEVEQELAAQRARFTDQNPTVQTLVDQQQRLQALLNQRIDRVAQASLQDLGLLEAGEQEQSLRSSFVESSLAKMGFERSLDQLEQEADQYRRRAEELPRLEQQQRDLERKLQSAQLTYETLLAGLQEARLKENQEVGNARIVSRATIPSLPANSSSLISLELIAGGILGGCLGLSLGMLLEIFDRSLRTEYEARGFFKKFPILGTIPAWSPDDWELDTEDDRYREINFDLPLLESPIGPESLLYPVSVAYRRLQTSLKLLNVDRRTRIIALTSSVPGEGKSATAANLALMLASLSNRVLLLEADLSAPQQHKIWKLSNIWGLSNILQDQITPEQTIQPVADNLDILSAGVGSPGIVALLDSDRMAITVRRLAEVYDYVIIDAPSLLVAPEIVSIGQIADGVMLVVRPGVLNKVDGALAQDTLNNTGMDILGIILNGVVSIPLRTPTEPKPESEAPDTFITDPDAVEDAELMELDEPMYAGDQYEYADADEEAAIFARIRKEAGLEDEDIEQDQTTVVDGYRMSAPQGRWSSPLGNEDEPTIINVSSRSRDTDSSTAIERPRRNTTGAAVLEDEAETAVGAGQAPDDDQDTAIEIPTVDVEARTSKASQPNPKPRKRWLSAITGPWGNDDDDSDDA